MKKWKRNLVIIAVIFLGLGIVKNTAAKILVTAGSSHILGTKVHIDRFAIGVFRPAVKIKGFKVYSPKGFGKDLFIDINEVQVRYSLPALLKGKIHLPLVALDLKEIVIVKNKDGELSVDSLKIVKDIEKSKDKKAAGKRKPKQMAFRIDEARLNLGKVIVKDHTQGDNPIVLAYDIGVKDKVYKDINSAQKFAALVMVEAIGPAGLKGAAIYGAVTVLGVGLFPAGIAVALVSKDTSVSVYRASPDKAYRKILKLIKKIGEVTKEDAKNHTLNAKVYGSDITVKIAKIEKKKTEVRVKARQLMVPKFAVASGITYQISKILK